ncbi:DUF982 domain-containing protein [Taklimakanibacter deserti]|uniref:DUF982 domain-containing protein n=1 Tax=Taklimakanibacter deserti TaxID=2267839 RepID=UPI000E65C6F2
MKSTRFEEPVTVLVGLGFPRRIESAIEAHQLLADIRLTTFETAHKAAVNACKAAVDGKIDPDVARSVFVAFARRAAMLVSEDPCGSKGRTRPTGERAPLERGLDRRAQ